jgi:hypothetical protein
MQLQLMGKLRAAACTMTEVNNFVSIVSVGGFRKDSHTIKQVDYNESLKWVNNSTSHTHRQVRLGWIVTKSYGKSFP